MGQVYMLPHNPLQHYGVMKLQFRGFRQMRRREKNRQRNRLPAPSFVTTVPTSNGDQKVGVYLLKTHRAPDSSEFFGSQLFESAEGDYHVRPVKLDSPPLQQLVPASPVEVAHLIATAKDPIDTWLYNQGRVKLGAPTSVHIITPDGKEIPLGRNATPENLIKAFDLSDRIQQTHSEESSILSNHQRLYGTGRSSELEGALTRVRERRGRMEETLTAMAGEEPLSPSEIKEAINERLRLREKRGFGSLEEHTQQKATERGVSELWVEYMNDIPSYNREEIINRNNFLEKDYFDRPTSISVETPGPQSFEELHSDICLRRIGEQTKWRPNDVEAGIFLLTYTTYTGIGDTKVQVYLSKPFGEALDPEGITAAPLAHHLPSIKESKERYQETMLGVVTFGLLTKAAQFLYGQYGSARQARRDLGLKGNPPIGALRAHRQNVKRMEKELGRPVNPDFYQR